MQLGQIHQGQVIPKFLISANPLVIGDKVSEPIENEVILINLDRLYVMRGMAVNEG
jgi:hypothetical protein